MLFFFIELLRKWNYNVGGELDNLEVIKEKHYGIKIGRASCRERV